MKVDKNIEQGERVSLPTKYGDFEIIPFQENETKLEHIALVKGDFGPEDEVLTRIHSACATGDLFGSLRCDCGEQLIKAMELIEQEGKGLLVYLQQEGRGIGLMNKIKAYKLQEEGYDTVDANLHLGFRADERNYNIASQILDALHIRKVRLMTNNPDKILGMELAGIEVKKRIPLEIRQNKFNVDYLTTKQERMNHFLHHLKTAE
ncbi:GTP cyclohydrolase II [Maribacter luteus]|uniref:GTP cyclohydrolase II n=1 Tax=Maribacter luteus TaxID=2594478 RepID=UPI002492D047|nr:GTP cyclohydrolase II [Maribacter luteus]